MNQLINRFDIIFTFFQVNRNVYSNKTTTPYNQKININTNIIKTIIKPTIIYAILLLVVHKSLIHLNVNVLSETGSNNALIDSVMTITPSRIIAMYIIGIYLCIRSINKGFAKRNVISRRQFIQIEKRILAMVEASDDIGQVNKKHFESLLNKYNKIYAALVIPSNTEIIMHKKHIKEIQTMMQKNNKNIKTRSRKQHLYFGGGLTHVNNRAIDSLGDRNHKFQQLLKYHQNAIDTTILNEHINNFKTIQDFSSRNKIKRHQKNTLRFQYLKLKTVQQVRNALRGI